MLALIDLFKRVSNNHFLFWLFLASPSIILVKRLLETHNPEGLLHPTGELSARLLIIALMLTPALRVSQRIGGFGSNIIRWFIARRRSIGVASFCYALAHTIFYLADIASIKKVFEQLPELGIWTGWLAIFVFIPLAMTSNNYSVLRMGRQWKNLQRLAYLAAIATLFHWIYVHGHSKSAVIQFTPLALLQVFRVFDYLKRRRQH